MSVEVPVGYVKVLVVNGEPFNRLSATGITMSNLFLGWPSDRLCQVYTANINPDPELCERNIRLSSKDLVPFSWIRSAGRSHAVGHSAGHLSAALTPHVPVPDKGRYGLRSRLRKGVAPFLDFLPYDIPSAQLREIRDFRPDVIYSMLGSIRMVRLVAGLSKRLQIPVVPHFMDDWMSTYAVPGRSVGSPLHVRYLRTAVEKLFESVPVAMSIGGMMSEEYSRKFARDFYDFMNPVDVQAEYPRSKVRGCERAVKFVYVGGLHLGRAEGLSDIAEAMNKLRSYGKLLELDIYAPVNDAPLAQKIEAISPSVAYKGSIPSSQVGEVLSRSDVAVHVESFAGDCAEYTRLSVSTKIPQYLSAGIPVFAYGPSSLASCRYVVDTEAGVLVGARSVVALENALDTLVSNSDFRADLGRSGWARAKAFHETGVVRDRFRSVLSMAAATAVGR